MPTMYKSLTATDRTETRFLHQKIILTMKEDRQQINQEQFSEIYKK